MNPSMRFSDADQFTRSTKSEHHFMTIGTHLQQLHTARNEQQGMLYRIALAKDRLRILKFPFVSDGNNLLASSRGSTREQ